MEEKTIYDLKLHESIKVRGRLWVSRVPGGWLYEYLGSTSVFVPYNDEFFPVEEKRHPCHPLRGLTVG